MLHILMGIPVLAVIPFLSGVFWIKKEINVISFAKAYVMGWMLLFAIYELIAMPEIFLDRTFCELTVIWFTVSLLIAGLGVLRLARKRFEIVLPKINKWIFIIMGLVLVQILMVIILQHTDMDDSFYLGTAMTSIDTNTLFKYDAYTGRPYTTYPWRYVFSPFPIFMASISWLCQAHPIALAHTVWPVVAVILFYLVICIYGNFFFREKKKFYYFFVIVNIFVLWGNWSIYTPTTFLLVRSWQGKAVLASIILPLLFYLLMEETKGVESYITLWIVVIAAGMVSSMGMILTTILLGVYAIIAFFNRQFSRMIQLLTCCIPCIVVGMIFMNR